MSRVAMFEGIRRRRKGRKSRKAMGKFPKLKQGYHWRSRKTRKDAGKKGGKTAAQRLFAQAAKSCPYPKSGSAKQRRSAYNDCIRKYINTRKSAGAAGAKHRRK